MIRSLALVALLLGAPALACGSGTDCRVPGGTYRIDAPERPRGAVLFAHGIGGSAAGVMRNRRLRAAMAEAGLALVALDHGGTRWSLYRGSFRDEAAYARAVRDDVARRTGLPPGRMILAGFSGGGGMVWSVSCRAPSLVAGFVPIGALPWNRERPVGCDGAAAIRHLHGTADRVVRPTDPGRDRLGARMAALRARHGMRAAAAPRLPGFDCDAWAGGGARLEYCLHPGGHRFDRAWLVRAWEDMAGR